MSKSLVLGNGSMLICYDDRAQVRDLYYPYVGIENHVGRGTIHRLGVFADGKMFWFTDSSWKIKIDYVKETLAAEIHARNEIAGVELVFVDAVYNEKNVFIRRVEIKNLRDDAREIVLFFNQEFQIAETNYAATAYYDPKLKAVIHYRGRRVFLVGGEIEHKQFDDYSVGVFNADGKEGTWRDAEDGVLSKNPIEHGSVDSTISFHAQVSGKGKMECFYWLVAAETIEKAAVLQEYVRIKTPDHVIKSTRDFWRAWVNKRDFTFHGLAKPVVELFKKSLFIIRTHADKHGSIIASGDWDMFQYGKDTYAYMWPRDGALVALALDKAGYFDTATRFFSFCNEVISREGYLFHKYRSDKSLGSSWHPWFKDGKPQYAIQEDESALVLFALWEHYRITKDLEFIEDIYNSFIKRTAEFLVRFRERKTGLPAASYDLWEEKFGISTFTASSVYGALEAAARFAELLGKQDDAREYHGAAEVVQRAILKYLWNADEKSFYKHINVKDDIITMDRTIDSSSAYGVFRFGVVSPTDERLLKAIKTTRAALQGSDGFGVARYAGDMYHRTESNSPGNPWFICALWFLQHDIAVAKNEKDLARAIKGLEWVCEHALPSGILSEQLHPETGHQLSVAPLTWSHSEFVFTVICYLEKLEDLGICEMCYPIKE